MQGCSVTTCGEGGAVVSTGMQGCSVTICNQIHSDALRRTPTRAIRRTPTQSGAIRRNQTHSNALRRTPTQSGAIRRNQTHSDGLTWSSVSLRAVTVYVVERIDGSTLRPPTCGEGRGAVVSTCMQGCSVDGCT